MGAFIFRIPVSWSMVIAGAKPSRRLAKIVPLSWPPAEESPPVGAPQQVEYSLEAVPLRQLQGAAAERPVELS